MASVFNVTLRLGCPVLPRGRRGVTFKCFCFSFAGWAPPASGFARRLSSFPRFFKRTELLPILHRLVACVARSRAVCSRRALYFGARGFSLARFSFGAK